jgi:acyl transferase domain-containing protein
VVVGISNLDYLRLQDGGPAATDPYAGTGNAFSIAANRLSYLLDLRGPSWAVDTACSSSLVAVHQACESLRRRECDAMLSGGVNLILAPDLTAVFTRAGMMSPTQRCRTFDAAADGYVRGEGAAMVVLKRLSDARRDGDTIQAVIRGSAVNQDGRSNGLTAPNGTAQQAVIRAALGAAGVAPSRIGYVEAHGTGTPLGDPIEMNALTGVLDEGRTAVEACAVGSVKTNIGHLESAAGLAGLIKTVLALQHAAVPANLHYVRSNPHIALAGTPFFVPTAMTAWPDGDGTPRLAGVSAFGFGGWTAHVITLSARSEGGLRARAGLTAEFVRAHPDVALADIAFAGNTGRSALLQRAAVVCTSSAEAIAQLELFAANGVAPRVVSGRANANRVPQLAFLFTGQGSQYAGMARDLFDSEPVFRRAMLGSEDRFRQETHRSLLDVIYPPARNARIDDTLYTQPALFALGCALAQVWASWGIVPTAVLGHSVGEYAAAVVAGVFDEDDGLRLVAARARLMAALPRTGSMRVVFGDLEPVSAAAAPYADRLSVAAANGPGNTVISGESAAMAAVVAVLDRAGVASLALNTSHAFHSPLMKTMVAKFRAVAETIAFRPPRLPIVSNVTGRIADDSIATADYWSRQILAPVQFGAGVATLHAAGCGIFLELGPTADLIGMGRRAMTGRDIAWIASLRRDRSGWDSMADAAAALFVNGAAVDWTAFDAGRGRSRVVLPCYPFERQRCWIDVEAAPTPAADPAVHPLLGHRLTAMAHAPDVDTWESSLSLDRLPYLADHAVLGSVVLPYAAFVEMALAAMDRHGGTGPHRVVDLQLRHPVVLPSAGQVRVQTTLDRTATGAWRCRVFTHSQPAWTLVASAVLEARTDHEIWPDVLCRE